MKNLVKVMLILLALSPLTTQAGSFGAGIIIGNPTGLSFKNWLDRVHAIDLALAWDLGGEDSFSLHGDYLWHKYAVFEIDELPIDFYYGLGARLLFHDNNDSNGRNNNEDDGDVSIGPRAPAGLRYQFRDPKIEIFVEAALILELIPDTDADIDLGIGARFFF